MPKYLDPSLVAHRNRLFVVNVTPLGNGQRSNTSCAATAINCSSRLRSSPLTVRTRARTAGESAQAIASAPLLVREVVGVWM